MHVQQTIETKLAAELHPQYMQVVNESSNHNVPPGSESHFKVTIVSDQFNAKNLLARHRLVNQVLAEELKSQIHALALHTYTLDEWNDSHAVAPMSPPCLGGGKS